MRVLQLTQRFPPALGGVETHVYNLAAKLTERGIGTEVWTTDLMREVPFQRLNNSHLQFPFGVRRFRAVKVLAMPHGLGIMAPAMIPAALSKQAEVLHAHSYGYFPTFVGALASRTRRIPLVITTHSDAGRPSISKRIFDAVVPSLSLMEAQRIIALTKSELDYLVNLGVPEKRISIIPNGVNLEEFEGMKHRVRSNGIARILFVGRVYPEQKGLEVLVRAIAKIKPATKLIVEIVGEDWGGSTSILRLARELGVYERVILVGPLGRNELLETYASTDLLVLPSLFEPFGIVLLEGMAAGLPVVASHVGGIPEVVEEGETGLLVEPGSPEKLASALEQLIFDRRLRRSMGEAGRERAYLFSWDRIVSKIMRVYEEAIDEKAT